MYSPLGLRFVDDFTTKAPIGSVTATLEIADQIGNFQTTDIKGVITPSGFLIYPRLERRKNKLPPSRRYRVTVVADYYFPLYPATQTIGTPQGIVFNAFPYDDQTPPASGPTIADLAFLPAPQYPFAGVYPVVRGIVRDQNGPVEGAMVTDGQKERVITDKQGAYSIGLRWVQSTVTLSAFKGALTGTTAAPVDVRDPNSRDICQTITIQ